MPDFKRLASDFAVSAQMTEADVRAAKAAGFATLVNNRPDGEAPDQTPGATIAEAARAAGMVYVEIPVAGAPSDDAVAETVRVLGGAARPILAYCRSGMRSSSLWALASARSGALTDEEILGAAAGAGYDLGPLAARLSAERRG